MKMKLALQTVAYKSVYTVTYLISLLPMGFLYAMASFTFSLFITLWDIGKR